MTYLQLVNNVLKRLREDEVSTVTENDYSSLIGTFVNDARILVDDAWQWSSQKTTIDFDTTVGTKKYSLVGIKPRSEVQRVIDTAENRFLRYKAYNDYRRLTVQSTVPNSDPMYFSFNGTDTNGDMELHVYPAPNSIRTVEVDVIKRTTELEDDADTLTIPTNPVTQLAFAMAIQERGEVQGLSSTQQFAIGQRALQDAIALDAQYSLEELDWNNGYDWGRK